MSARPGDLTLTNWDMGGEPSAWAYLHAGTLFPSVEIPPAGPVLPLAEDELATVAGFDTGAGMSLDAYVAAAPVSGIVVVRGGRIVFERYPRMRPDDRHLLMSVSKVFASVLVGLLEERGQVDLSRPVDAYVKELAGSGWAGVPVRDVLGMASGIDCREVGNPGAYTDPADPFYRFEATLGWRPPVPETAYSVVSSLSSAGPSGEVYEYTSVNTFVLGWLVSRVTGLSLDAVLAREIWSRGGFEAPLSLCVSADGAPAIHGGLSMRLRDLARFGMLFTAASVISAEHLRRIRSRDGLALRYPGAEPVVPWPPSRQWNCVYEDGDLFKSGFGGQGLYVSVSRDLVIAYAGTPREDGAVHELGAISRRLALALLSPEALVDLLRLLGEEGAGDVDPALAAGEHLAARQRQGPVVRVIASNRDEFGLGQAVDDAGDAGPVDGARAHRARLGARVQGRPGELVVAELRLGFADQVDLRVPGPVPAGDHRVLRLEHLLAVHHQHGAERVVAVRPCPPRHLDRGRQMPQVITVVHVPAGCQTVFVSR
ncbi:MAG TPA: serine hydrolase domain-containing protein [Streptosporangiaceae bacterium]|nr:serine hydrolase domain-containing protein [Streptosporangiaceae bacterium]